jgi:transcriptional regulator with XRE-family HTH domain
MDTKLRFGLRVRELRKRRGLTQDQLAELIERSTDAVSNLERGISLPNFDTLERLSEKLSVPIREFFDFDDPNDSPERTRMLAAIRDVARQLSDADLRVALSQIEALRER